MMEGKRQASFFRRKVRRFFLVRTRLLLRFDLLRAKTRFLNRRKNVVPPSTRLHLGCGKRMVKGWLNVDIVGSEFDIDLSAGRLPWVDQSFTAIVSQHVIEHLEIRSELMPLLSELRRIMKPGGEIWLSCPDMEKVCRGYVHDKGSSLNKDRCERLAHWTLDGMPIQQIINDLFHQDGEHKNLFDFELLKWVLETCQFKDVTQVAEKELLARFPEFPARNDDAQTLYVKAAINES